MADFAVRTKHRAAMQLMIEAYGRNPKLRTAIDTAAAACAASEGRRLAMEGTRTLASQRRS